MRKKKLSPVAEVHLTSRGDIFLLNFLGCEREQGVIFALDIFFSSSRYSNTASEVAVGSTSTTEVRWR